MTPTQTRHQWALLLRDRVGMPPFDVLQFLTIIDDVRCNAVDLPAAVGQLAQTIAGDGMTPDQAEQILWAFMNIATNKTPLPTNKVGRG